MTREFKIMMMTMLLVTASTAPVLAADNYAKEGVTGAAGITVTLTGIKDIKGAVTAGLYNSEDAYKNGGTVRGVRVDVAADTVIISYSDLPDGEYTIKLFHDVNGNGDLDANLIHDFCMTKKHLIFVAPSFRATQKSDTFFDMFKWLPNESQRVIVVEKDDLDNRREYDLPPGFQFHYGNAWEDKSGDIRFSVCTGDSGFVQRGARALMRGETFDASPARLAHVVLRKNGSAKIESILSERATHEFPQFNANYQGTNARYLYTVGDQSQTKVGQMSILKHDFKTGEIKVHNYGSHSLAEEHLFIPRSGAVREDDGWLIGTTLNLKTKSTRLNILDAQHMGDDPVAVLELPYAVPLGFHGAWKGAM